MGPSLFMFYSGGGGRMYIRYCGTGITMVEVLHSCVTTVLTSDSASVRDTTAGLSCR